ncbi:MAG: alpha-xylosidase, partial [Bifidobacterium castoris]|nr:alpha-xylosidase [Bifidobacterium castoris]
DAHEHGPPGRRSLFVEFPDDPACRTLDRQYMLGPSLLVAPVFSYSGDVSYYLPAGGWTNWFTGEHVRSEHGMWRTEHHDFDSVPLWVRDGSVVVTHPGATTPDYDYADDPDVRVFLGDETEASATVTCTDGRRVVFTARRDGDGVIVNRVDG